MRSMSVLSGRSGTILLLVGLLAGLAIAMSLGVPKIVGAQEQAEQQPEELEEGESPTGGETLVAYPVEVDLTEEGDTWIYGSGFAPGTEVILMIEDGNGVMTDITAAGTEFPLEANDQGAFGTHWVLDRFSREGVGAEGMYTLWAVDSDFETLATAPLALCAITEREEAAGEEPTTPEPGEGPATPAPGDGTPAPTPDVTPAPAPGGASGQPQVQEEGGEEEEGEDVPNFCSS